MGVRRACHGDGVVVTLCNPTDASGTGLVSHFHGVTLVSLPHVAQASYTNVYKKVGHRFDTLELGISRPDRRSMPIHSVLAPGRRNAGLLKDCLNSKVVFT